MTKIPAYSSVEFSVEGGERIRIIMEQHAREIVPLADELIVSLIPHLEALATTKARSMQVPPEAIAMIQVRTFKTGGSMKPVFRGVGGTSIAIGFSSATELGGMTFLREVGGEYEQSMWTFGEYPPGRRLWQEEFGLAGTRYPEAQVISQLQAAGQRIWAPPPYSAMRGKTIGVHWRYGEMKRDSRGRLQPLEEGPGRPPKGFLRASIREIAQIFTIEFSKKLKTIYNIRNKKALTEAGTYGKKI